MPNGYENFSVDKMNDNKGYSRDFTIKAKSENYNGVIAQLKYGDIEFVAFKSTQIKLADGSNTTFDINNPDIRYDNGGQIKDLLSSQEIEHKLGRELHWWNDDIVYLSGIKYKKVYLRPEYKRVIE
jgi:hypothetical protein